jgi:2-methylisocitrate lyase-like PEP mutase family enzyme
MNDILNQNQKALAFRALHHATKLFVLPNIWDVLGAALLEDIGYPAIATASASIAYTNGFQDGEQIPFSQLLSIVKQIVKGVSLPVSVDFESGYARSENRLQKNVTKLIEAGAIGMNIEDTNKYTGKLYSPGVQAGRITAIRDVAEKMNIPLFINARTDIFIEGKYEGDEEDKLKQTILRGKAYKQAGADGFYPILIKDIEIIQMIKAELQMPLNILLVPGLPPLKELEKLGIARVSLGPGFLCTAVHAMKEHAMDLKNLNSFGKLSDNLVTSDYLKKLTS